jgi:tripartite-type tricarboxylate transporter receptor subunit TctC
MLTMKPMRWILLLALGVPFVATAVEAQNWPTKPLRAVIPIGAGGPTDIIPRIVFEQLSSQLGQAVVVENRVGAGGMIGAAFAAKANSDG